MAVADRSIDLGRAKYAWLATVLLLVLSVAALSPDGLSGWWIVYLLSGGALAAVAATVTGRLSRTLWTIAGFVIGGTLMVMVFRQPFDWRHGCGILLLVALLVLQTWQTNGSTKAPNQGL